MKSALRSKTKDCEGTFQLSNLAVFIFLLVIDDIIGISNSTKKPKFVKSYANIEALIHKAVEKFCSEVIKKKFPKNKNTYK